MQTWSGFYSAMAGAAAALLGLLFVSVSINVGLILGEAHEPSRRLAEQAFENYLTVLLVSLLALFPSIGLSDLGLETLGIAAVRGALALMAFYRALTRPSAPGVRRHWLRRQFAFVVGFGLLIYASWQMASQAGDSRNTFAAGTLTLLFSATTVSWELLLRIAAGRPD